MAAFRTIAIAAVMALASAGCATQNPRPPNFLLILADDMGFGDAGSYGGEIATPNLDALAAGGLRFTQFYNTSRCWPTRAALLTGYYPQQIRRDGMPGVSGREFGGRGVRPGWARLVSDRLAEAGYRSYHSGKWHIDGDPLGNGFTHSYRVGNRTGFFHLSGQDEDGTPLEDIPADEGVYMTTLTADYAIESLRCHQEQAPDQPFFQFLAFHSPHFPLHARPEDIERYSERYLDGWDELRVERHARQTEMGIHDGALSALDEDSGPPYHFPDAFELLGPGEVNRPVPWAELSLEQQKFQATKMAIHAAMIDRMDIEIGRVLDQIRAMGEFDNTLVMFLSDNGASAEIMVRGDGHDPGASPGSAGTYLCLGPGFSSAANTPFRLHKTWVHEGGIATPLIAHWPAGIAARGELRSAVGHVIDIAPTMLDLAGLSTAPDPGAPTFAGTTLAPVFDRDGPLHDTLWFFHEGNRALRRDDWKILHTVTTRDDRWVSVEEPENAREGEWALFDLNADRAEQHDVAASHPEVVEELDSVWNEWRERFIREATAAN